MAYKFEKLEVWQMAVEYIDMIYKIAELLPKNEEYNLHRYHGFGVAAQLTHHITGGVRAGARGRTHDDRRDALMAKMGPPLTQGTVVDNPVGLGGTDPVPAV